jgi:hypothetical protein
LVPTAAIEAAAIEAHVTPSNPLKARAVDAVDIAKLTGLHSINFDSAECDTCENAEVMQNLLSGNSGIDSQVTRALPN